MSTVIHAAKAAVHENPAPFKPSTIAVAPQSAAETQAAQDALLAEELKLPKKTSLGIMLFANVLMQWTFFIIVASSNEYSLHLGGSSTFAGLVIGIPTVVAALTLIPLLLIDQGVYARPLHVACGCLVLGNALYALAYKADFLYLILIGRMVMGAGMSLWMYIKKYCSDARIVGTRRRTTLAGWQVLGQGIGFSLGPFLGGLRSRINLDNALWNGYTSPGWIMAASWLVFWVIVWRFYEDVPITPPAAQIQTQDIHLQPLSQDSGTVTTEPTPATSQRSLLRPSSSESETTPFRMSWKQMGVSATMSWWAMTSFFLLGSWEANIPVFTASDAPANPFHFSPFASGNLIALGGACTIPFLMLNLYYGRRMQDRNTLVIGSVIGMAGLLIAISIFSARAVNYGSLFCSWLLIAIGFNLTSTVTIALLSKQMPPEWNGRISILIQCSNYTGRVTGSVWGGAGVKVGMQGYVGLQIGYVVLGTILYSTLWRNLKAKTG